MSKWLERDTTFKKEIPVELSPIKVPPNPHKKETEHDDKDPYRPGATGEEMLPAPRIQPMTYGLEEEQRDPNYPVAGFPKREKDYKSVWGEGQETSITGPGNPK